VTFLCGAGSTVTIIRIIACSCIRVCTHALSSCYFCVTVFTLCSFVRTFLRPPCVPRSLPVVSRNMVPPCPQRDDGQCTKIYQGNTRMVPTYQGTRFYILKGLNFNEPQIKKKLRGSSPLANYTDRAIAAGQRS
jgi:hypothetical protein